MKVLFVQKLVGIAGSENYLLQAVPALREAGVDVEFLCLSPRESRGGHEPFKTRMLAAGIPFHVEEYRGFPSILALRRIADLRRRGRFDIVHTHLIHADVVLALTKVLFDRRMVLASTKHGYHEGVLDTVGLEATQIKKNLYYFLCRFTSSQANGSFAISDGLRNFFVKHRLESEKGLRRIHYGFSFREPDPESVPRFRFAPHQLVIVGRLVAFKGHRFVLSLLPDLVIQFPDLKLVIVGVGPLEQDLRNRVAKGGLHDHVVFTGYKTNPQDYMRDSDLVLVPSVSEGFGVVFLEAFNSGRPVVAFDVPAGNEILEDGVSGALIQPFDTQAMGKEISRLLEDETIRHEMGACGHERLLSYFSAERQLRETLTFYSDLLA